MVSDSRDALYGRIRTGALLLLLVVFLGTAGYHTLGSGRWTWAECLYMTMITLSTVGYGEVLDGMATVPWARGWTVVLIVLGSGTLVYFASTLTAFVLEGDLKGVLRRRKMQNAIDALNDHVIVCGLGLTGRHIVEELLATKTPFCVIEQDPERIRHVEGDLHGRELLWIHGDTTEDAVLEQAGLARARGLVAALKDDRDNLFVTLSARTMNERLRIVAKAGDHANAAKLRKAGANAVVLPTFIGGMRMVSEMVRPSVVQFLDEMLRGRDSAYRIEEVTVPAGVPLCGVKLGEANLKDVADVLVISVRDPAGAYRHNPPTDTMIEANTVLVLLAKIDEIARLRDAIAKGRAKRR